MSTQLILLPQTYLGVSSGTGGVQLVSDGVSFNTINSSTAYTNGGAAPLHNLMNVLSLVTAFTTSSNIWFRWKTSGGSWLTPLNPKETAGNLVLNTEGSATPPTSSGSGVIQRLSNLSIGTSYIIELKVSAPTPPPGN